MKQLLLIPASLLLINTACAQSSFTFPDSNARWVDTYSVLVGPTLVLTGVHNYCMDGSDTVINAHTYSQIHYCDSAYKGGTRTDSNRVYFIPRDSMQEYILYDFNMTAAGGIFHN